MPKLYLHLKCFAYILTWNDSDTWLLPSNIQPSLHYVTGYIKELHSLSCSHKPISIQICDGLQQWWRKQSVSGVMNRRESHARKANFMMSINCWHFTVSGTSKLFLSHFAAYGGGGNGGRGASILIPSSTARSVYNTITAYRPSVNGPLIRDSIMLCARVMNYAGFTRM